jgi:RNA polymerase sigma-70 factor (ECF subfamily)
MDWIGKIKSDPDKSLATLYHEYQNQGVNWIISSFGLSKDEAEEVFQTSLVLLYDNVVTGKLTELTANIKTYLFAIIKNKIIHLNRSKNRFSAYDATELLSGVIDEEYEEISQEDLLKASKSMTRLGEPCKTLLELSYYQELSMEEISNLMGYKNADTTKNLKYKCLKRLQKIFFE